MIHVRCAQALHFQPLLNYVVDKIPVLSSPAFAMIGESTKTIPVRLVNPEKAITVSFPVSARIIREEATAQSNENGDVSTDAFETML